MKKKINANLIMIAVVAILATLVMTSAAFYNLFCEQVFEDLRIYSEILEVTESDSDWQKVSPLTESDLRITVVDGQGTVLFDNKAESSEMENHSQRPEIQAALEVGEGEAVRRSETLDKSTFYYARVLENGQILRVAKEAQSIWSVFGSALPLILLILILLTGSCMIIAHLLTKSLIRPMENMARDLDNIEEIETYEELQPFISRIKKQHQDIVKNAMVRQEFTANVTHELKTPLTAISGYSELIETGMASDEDVIRFAKGIHKNSNRLLSLINDIIKLSELDGDGQEEVFENVNLYSLAQTCIDMLQISADNHHVKLELIGKDCFVKGNRQELEEVLYNLCSNAIRYNNENGRVTVTVKSEDKKTMLIVEDTGIGIPKESLERVFERFYRVDKSRSKSTGGTGLGLAIVKHIVMRHNADIHLESEVGKGTRVTVTFI